MRTHVIWSLLLGLLLAHPSSALVFPTGGAVSAVGGGTQACDPNATNVCALFQNGQTFVTWNDLASGSAGNAWRYKMYRSTSPITAGNYLSATLIADKIFNNSAMLIGGNPDDTTRSSTGTTTNGSNTITGAGTPAAAEKGFFINGTGIPANTSVSNVAGNVITISANATATGSATFTFGHQQFNQTARQDANQPGYTLSFNGTPLANATGLQVYTALGSQNAFYAIVGNNGSDSYIGSVGPIAETLGNGPVPIKYADGASRTAPNSAQFAVGVTAGLPLILSAHQSESAGGPVDNSQFGDYWQMFGDATMGYQDGGQLAFAVRRNATSFQVPTLQIQPRDTWWKTDGTGAVEVYHMGPGMTPNPLVGPANRFYRSNEHRYLRMISWAISNYGVDANQIHWGGASMGGWGGANTAFRHPEVFAGIWLGMPIFRMDHRGNQSWPMLTCGLAFSGTIAACPTPMGAVSTIALTEEGLQWGGNGAYTDIPNYAATNKGQRRAPLVWSIGKGDGFALFADEVAMANGLETGKRFYSFAWNSLGHQNAASAANDYDISGSNHAYAYQHQWFALNRPYLAYSNSSINDNPGTGTQISGVYDGDIVGCMGCGFHFTISTDQQHTFAGTSGNSYMGQSPTVQPATTTLSSIAASGSGSVTLSDATGWRFSGLFAQVDNEVIALSALSGTTLSFTGRGQFGTTAASHASGAPIKLYVDVPTGPNGGSVSSMTADATIRNPQLWGPSVGTAVACVITPFGGAPSTQNLTVDSDGLTTMSPFPINVGGDTSFSCTW